jgi:RNA polymerase sigma-70 factor (ECF subfamily)
MPYVTPSDSDAIRRVQAGDVEAFSVLVDRHHDRLSRYALHMLGNRADAEEAVQDTWVRAFRALSRYEDRDQFGAWVMRILANRCRTIAVRRPNFEPLDPALFEFKPGEDQAEQMAIREDLANAMAQLPPDQREAVTLRFADDLSLDEMSAVTGAGVSALKMRVKRACDRLRRILEDGRARI